MLKPVLVWLLLTCAEGVKPGLNSVEYIFKYF